MQEYGRKQKTRTSLLVVRHSTYSYLTSGDSTRVPDTCVGGRDVRVNDNQAMNSSDVREAMHKTRGT